MPLGHPPPRRRLRHWLAYSALLALGYFVGSHRLDAIQPPWSWRRTRSAGDGGAVHLALISDASRLGHCLQAIRSALAVYSGTETNVVFHYVLERHAHANATAELGPDAAKVQLYDYDACERLVQAVRPFSDPSIHVSAHCKFLLADILLDIDRALYLDTDTTVIQDVAPCISSVPKDGALFRMAVDMGDVCQRHPDRCWPIGFYKHSSDGLLEPVQVNGGVVLLELDEMRTRDFTRRYVHSVVMTHRVTGIVASYGDQDFINSYIRLHPEDFAFLPCGCNYQWWGRTHSKCAGEPVYIAHHW